MASTLGNSQICRNGTATQAIGWNYFGETDGTTTCMLKSSSAARRDAYTDTKEVAEEACTYGSWTHLAKTESYYGCCTVLPTCDIATSCNDKTMFYGSSSFEWYVGSASTLYR